MFDKILLAVGGDDESYEPARVAGRLACLLGAKLTITTVHRATPARLGEPYYTESVNERLEETDAIIGRARQTAEREGATVTDIQPLEGPAVDKIVELARLGGYGLIVMGTRARGRLQSALLGSVSAGVAAHSTVPVLVVPEAEVVDDEKVTQALVSTDASR